MLTRLESDTLTTIVSDNAGATVLQIGRRLQQVQGRAPSAKDLQALLAGLVARGLLRQYTVAALVPAYSLTAQGVEALDTPPESTQLTHAGRGEAIRCPS